MANRSPKSLSIEEYIKNASKYHSDEYIFVEPSQSWFTCKHAVGDISLEEIEKLKDHPRYEQIKEVVLRLKEEEEKRDKSLEAFFSKHGFPQYFLCTNKKLVYLSEFFNKYRVEGRPNPQGGYTPVAIIGGTSYSYFPYKERRRFFKDLGRVIRHLKQDYKEEEIIRNFIEYTINSKFCFMCLSCKYHEKKVETTKQSYRFLRK